MTIAEICARHYEAHKGDCSGFARAVARELDAMAMGAGPRLDTVAWLDAPYQPVPTIVDAACMLYARHNVADIRAARTDAVNLRATSDAILREIDLARTQGRRLILFVTGNRGRDAHY